MRILMLLACLGLCSSALPASAEGLNNLKAGVNSISTFAADPILMVWEPPDDFEDLPWHTVTGRVFALPTGVLLSAYRLGIGVFDIAFTPFYYFPTMSPEPRWFLIDDVEYE